MRAIYFVGILAFFLITVGTASAATYYLTAVNEPDDVPSDATIKVKVTCIGNTITFQDESTGISEPAIKTVMYNLNPPIIGNVDWNNDKIELSDCSFDQRDVPPGFPLVSNEELNELFNRAGFGHFLSLCEENSNERTSRVDVILLGSCSGILPNENGRHAVVHLQFQDAGGNDGSIWVTDESSGVSGDDEGSWVADDPEVPIPEFPSIVLPVAAIMGILLISQRRKK